MQRLQFEAYTIFVGGTSCSFKIWAVESAIIECTDSFSGLTVGNDGRPMDAVLVYVTWGMVDCLRRQVEVTREVKCLLETLGKVKAPVSAAFSVPSNN